MIREFVLDEAGDALELFFFFFLIMKWGAATWHLLLLRLSCLFSSLFCTAVYSNIPSLRTPQGTPQEPMGTNGLFGYQFGTYLEPIIWSIFNYSKRQRWIKKD